MEKRDFLKEPLISPWGLKKDKKETQVDALFEKYARKDLNLGSSASTARIGNITSGLAPYTGQWTDREILHLLRRTGFGYKKTEVDVLKLLTMSQAVDLVLQVNPTPPPEPVNWYQNLVADENGVPYGSSWVKSAFNSYTTGVITNAYRSEGLKLWLLGQALNKDITIREKMVWFWYHLIPVDFDDILESANLYCANNSARVCYNYMKMFRDFATGNFKSLIRAMATQPAMMYYLNNQANSKAAPDENFAREIMELFTLGKGPDSQYTQQDVIQAAKVLTGWRVLNLNQAEPVTSFVSLLHDTSNKQFSSFFNNTVITGTGADELDKFINMIFAKSEVVSRYICRRLYRFFVYYDIDENIETNIIQPLAQTFVNNNWEILPVLKQLFKSEHFYDMANRGVMIKSPFDLVIGSLRSLNITHNVAVPTNHHAQYQLWYTISEAVLDTIDQVMGEVPNVSGWPAYYQNPSFYQYWINTNTIQKRFNYLQVLFSGFISGANGLLTLIQLSELPFVKQFPNAICRDPDLLVTECIKYLLPVDLSPAQKETIKLDTLLYQQVNNNYWTSAWDTYISNPTLTNENIVKARLRSLFANLLQLAEFQLT